MITGRIYGFSAVNQIAKWWPVILIMLGIEILACNIFTKNQDVKIVFDGFSIFATIVIIIVSLGAFGITEAFKYFPDHVSNGFIFSSNYKYVTKVDKSYSIDASGKNKLVVSNEYGNTRFEKGTGKNIEVTANIQIRNDDEEYAKKISDSLVEIVKDNPVKITSIIGSYLDDRTKIKGITINYIIKVPDGIDVDTHSKFGDIEANDLSKDVYLENTNGEITVKNISGNLTVKNAFGNVEIDQVGGKADITDKNGQIEVKNIGNTLKVDNQFGNVTIENVKDNADIVNKFGEIDIDDIKGNLKAEDKNGTISLKNIGGTVDVSNEFGGIDIVNADKAVKVKDKNGNISFETNKVVTGDIDINNEFGGINISLAKNQQGHFKAYTKFGSLSSDFSFSIKEGTNEKSVDEMIGNSNLSFNLNNKNGNIDINWN
jgi:hypothetical protein